MSDAMRTPTPLLVLSIGAAALTAQAPQAPAVPLRPGLTIVTAIAENFGDYESIKRITAVNDKGYTLSYSADVPEDPDEDLGPGEKPRMREVRGKRTVLAADLQGAHEYVQKFGDKQPEVFKGSTALGVSAAVLNELKTRGESKITVLPEGIMGAIGGLLGGLLGGDGDGLTKMSGTLKVSKEGPKTLTVLVNGAPTPLPVVHATVDFDEETSGEFHFHDDPAHPISLKWTIGDAALQVVRIDFPAEQPAAAGATQTTAKPGVGGGGPAGGGEAATTSAASMEKALQTAGKVDIYGIYFDFASDRIKPESEPVLREIAKVMTDNPAWNLNVNGHTDNVGGAAYNLDLSKRRAAAVKAALVSRYKVAATRLETSGFGAGQPKAPNNTLAGRAQNRRVELVKK
jgi:outer membrane protein OmpA-like peptidoglycan-associated protein